MTAENISRYVVPRRWVHYDPSAVFQLLIEARTAGGVLNRMPYLPQWIEQAHEEQLRLEAAGTSRIEGAQFTQHEQDEALAPAATGATKLTHSQRQLRAADATYRWLRSRPAEQPVSAEFIRKIHRRIVTGCDDHNCTPGETRPEDWNVTFGTPHCRGAEGGNECRAAFDGVAAAIAGEFRRHDRLIQAIATHYHIGAMHPFGDGNGRTARALEAFMLRRAGVNDVIMVSLSNYYYEHKDEYLTALYESRKKGHDLTPFLKFALPAVAERCNVVAEGHRLQPPASAVPGIRQIVVWQITQSPPSGSGPTAIEDPGDSTGRRPIKTARPDEWGSISLRTSQASQSRVGAGPGRAD